MTGNLPGCAKESKPDPCFWSHLLPLDDCAMMALLQLLFGSRDPMRLTRYRLQEAYSRSNGSASPGQLASCRGAIDQLLCNGGCADIVVHIGVEHIIAAVQLTCRAPGDHQE